MFLLLAEIEFYCPVPSRHPCSLGKTELGAVLLLSNYQACYLSKTENHPDIVPWNEVDCCWGVRKRCRGFAGGSPAWFSSICPSPALPLIPDPLPQSAGILVCAAGRWTAKLILLENNFSQYLPSPLFFCQLNFFDSVQPAQVLEVAKCGGVSQKQENTVKDEKLLK